MEKKKLLVVSSEYSVKVRFGKEKLEHCIQQMLDAKRKNMQEQICKSLSDTV